VSGLSSDDIEFLIELLRDEINKTVDEKVNELRVAVTQAFVDMAIGQLRYCGVEIEPKPNGQVVPADE
jgi:predicted transcriptional regulator